MKTLKMIITIAAAISIATFQLSSAQRLESEEYSFEPKSASKASTYSLLATAVPVTLGTLSAFNNELGTDQLILISGGLIVGPSVGYLYAGMDFHGCKGIVYRSVLGAGAVLLGDHMGMEILGKDRDDDGWPVAIFGGAFLITHAIVDLAKVNSRVSEYNFQKLCEKEISVNIYPRYFADSRATGFGLSFNF
jgi:hypothetical protein